MLTTISSQPPLRAGRLAFLHPSAADLTTVTATPITPVVSLAHPPALIGRSRKN
jgi:hypothetical protein